LRILAVDHGEKRIGLAISDPGGVLVAPLMVIEHVSRLIDAAQVAQVTVEHDAGLVVIGQSFDEDGIPNLAGRRAARFADVLRAQLQVPVVLWDESLSSRDARALRLELGVGRKKRSHHLDDLAAVMILQSYLDQRGSG
jgi:putative Holliday junction resolvase